METLLVLAGLGAAGLALLLQSKSAVPSEADFKKALEKLKNEPGDADANTTVGKYYAFVLGDYENGLPYFVKSNDTTLRTLAEHELAPLYADTPAKKIVMGDEWITAAKNFKPLYRTFYDRASQWYAAAWPNLDGAAKDKLRDRFRKLLLLPTPGVVKKGLPATWKSMPNPNSKVSVDSTIAHLGGKALRIEMAKERPNETFFAASPLFVAPPPGPAMFSGWVASDGTDSANDRLVLNFYDQTGKNVGSLTPFLPGESPFWRKVELKVDVPKEAQRFEVGITLASTKGIQWIDDFSLKSDNKEFVENGSFEK